MFAIEISKDTERLIKFLERETLPKDIKSQIDRSLRHNRRWYLIRGYVPQRGPMLDYAILPAFVFEDRFEYDPDNIKKTWDQIVRK